MKCIQIQKILRKFNWSLLRRVYGSAHSTIIGFIASEWLKQSEGNSILDVAPSPIIGKGRAGQKNADLLLCKADKPLLVVEVETHVESYEDRLETLFDYLGNKKEFKGIEAGLLIMGNYDKGDRKYRHNWGTLKSKVKSQKDKIAFVSIERGKAALDNSTLDRLRNREYHKWDIENIEYWIHTGERRILKGKLWRRK